MKKLFNSFPFWWFLKIAAFKILRRLFKMELKFVFSQAGEDLIINKLLRMKKGLFYLDIGCNHPVVYSNTLNMYIDGGRGICVDANSKLTEKFKKIRPRDIVVNSAVSDEEEEVTFHISDDDLVSTMDPETLEKWSETWKFTAKEKLKTQTLDKILEDHLPENQKIDVLSIDVEGYDFKVLRSLNLNKYKPDIIVIEIHDLNFYNKSFENNEIVAYLKSYGYELKYYANINAYFVPAGKI